MTTPKTFASKTAAFLLLIAWLACPFSARAAEPSPLWAAENIAAWCIVPFDAKKRGPEERAVMLEKLGIHRLAYDYRAEHIPTFDAEIEAMKRHKIEFMAWWFPTVMNDEAELILRTIEKHKITPQLWVMGGGEMLQPGKKNDERVASEAQRIKTIAVAAKRVGCKVALYNHGAWFGEPENQIAIIETLRREQIDNVGIVYNFHHGHEHLPRFGALMERMKPYLLTVNLNGMIPDGEKAGKKILNLAGGTQELEMMRVMEASGWRGDVGIIDHRETTDSEETLRDNLKGLAWLKAELVKAGSGGPRPFAVAKPGGSAQLGEGKKGRALDATKGGLLLPGNPEFRKLPLVIDCWTRLKSSKGFNILAASDPKSSSQHWELYSFSGTGEFCVYQPGRGGNFNSGVGICDDQWHHVAAVIEEMRVRLFVDGALAKELPAATENGKPQPGGLAVGRLVEGGIGCDGLVDELRIHRGTELDAHHASLGEWSFESLETKDEPREVTPFFPTASPLNAAAHPYATHPINRDRIYDFYGKQAVRFAGEKPLPELLPSYPGLDSGRYGHWGNQNDEIWRDTRWNEMDAGGLLCGITKIGNRRIPRAVCLQLGEKRELAACFDTEKLTWDGVWDGGGLVQFDSFRWGMLSEILPKGAVTAAPVSQSAGKRDIVYHGFYRNGGRVIFSYAQEGEEWLESAWVQDEKFSLSREKRGGSLDALTKGGAAQWPQVFETKGTLGKGSPYAIDSIDFPTTPWKSIWHIGGHDFLPNGDAALCTFEGEVWVVSGLDDSLGKIRWRRFAAGLSQPLGLRVIDGKICVLGRDQVTRLHDLNNDGEADFYEAYSRAYETPVGGHDYLTGLETDAQGRMYFAGGKMGVSRISADRKTNEVLATGFRNPNGVAVGPKGEVIAGVQEGEWTAASWIAEITPGGHYRHGGPKPGPLGDLAPTLYFPRGVDNSCGGHIFTNSDKWGLPDGALLHFSWGTGTAFLILREEIDGQKQGCAVPLPGEFRSGAHRGRFRTQDGHLYVSGMTGWGTYTPEDGSFERMRYTGGAFAVPKAVHSHENGIRLEFAEPLNAAEVKDGRFFAQQWNYRIGPAYGSDEYSVRFPGTRGHDVLEVKAAHILNGGRTLFVEIPQFQPSHQVHLHVGIKSMLSRDLFLTTHRVVPAFTQFPGYVAVAKTAMHNHNHHAASRTAAAAQPVKWEQGEAGRALKIQTAAGMQFAQKELRAKAGERVSLTLENPDVMPHNWVLIQPGSIERVGQLANQLIAAPDAITKNYVPESADVICNTRVLDPQKSTTIHFTVPSKPGRYPYLCSFPGHWMLMRGELIVE